MVTGALGVDGTVVGTVVLAAVPAGRHSTLPGYRGDAVVALLAAVSAAMVVACVTAILYHESPATTTYVAAGRFWLTRSEGKLFALTQNCPHLGCRLPYCEGSGRFECPCHGSQFNLGGEWISGPSPRGIDRFALSVDEGRVVVDTRTLVEGPPLGAKEHERPALGASCVNLAT